MSGGSIGNIGLPVTNKGESMTIKVGDRVLTKVGFGVVVAKRKEPFGHYVVYDVEIDGKVWTCRNVYLDK
jgi:hypothetical protein